jgi:hypothetical protein
MPGSTFPSTSSKEAPPPVDKWDKLLLAPGTRFTKEIVSPPPQTVVTPFLEALTSS